MKVKLKKLDKNAVIPSYAKEGDAGLDLTASSILYSTNSEIITYGTGLSIEIPKGYVGLIFPRSSIVNYDLELTNSVGVIDSGYRGEIMLKFRITGIRTDIYNADVYKVGDRVGQLIIVPYPSIEFEETEVLSESERGLGGYGSTNK